MSGILRYKKCIAILLLLVFIILLFTASWLLSGLVLLLGLLLLYLNFYIFTKSNRIFYLSAQREIKNYNCLIIGDICSDKYITPFLSNNDCPFTLMAPSRSMEASYQILLHIISLFEGEGFKCIFIESGKRNKFSVFDIPYLSFIRRKELDLEILTKKHNYPLFFAPLDSLSMLFNISVKRYTKDVCTNDKLLNFCSQKNIQLIYIRAEKLNFKYRHE